MFTRDNPSLPGAEHHVLSPDSWARLVPHWLSASVASQVMRRVLSELPFEQHAVLLFGKRVAQPRLISWCGTRSYTYSGLTLAPRPFPVSLQPILESLSAQCGAQFNHMLANLYRDGSDGMGMHADNERELGSAPIVSCLSLGEARRFVLKARDGGHRITLTLGSGSLLVMGGKCQHEFVHGIPKTTRTIGKRLSLTFRCVL